MLRKKCAIAPVAPVIEHSAESFVDPNTAPLAKSPAQPSAEPIVGLVQGYSSRF